MMGATGARRVAAAAGLAVLLLLGAAVTPATAQVDAEGKISITPKDFCMSCMSVVELFFSETIQRADEKRKREGDKAHVMGTELMQAICDQPMWKQYHTNLVYGCRKLLQEYQADVFGTFNGKHTFGNDEEIYEHKRRVCTNVGACKPAGMVVSTLRKHTPCGACQAIAQDIEFTLDRERKYNYKNKKRMAGVVASICDDLGIRHPEDHKAYLEDFCDEILEDVGVGAIAGTYKLRKSMEGSVVKLTQSFADKLCSEMTSYCPKKDPDAPAADVAPVGAEPFIVGADDGEAAPGSAEGPASTESGDDAGADEAEL